MAAYYPGDQAVAVLAMMTLAVSTVSVVALLVAIWFRRHHPARHSLLFSAMLCSLFVPLISVVFWGTGVSFISLPLLAEEATWLQPEPVAVTSPDGLGEFSPFITAHAPPVVADRDHTIVDPRYSGATGASLTVKSTVPEFRLLSRSGIAIVIIIWLIGCLVSLASVAQQAFRLSRLYRASGVLPPERLRRISTEIASSLGIEELPPVLLSAMVNVPIACGIYRRVVILPSGLISKVTDDQLRDVLTHETAHLLRHDPLVLLLQRISGSLFWPIPFVHLVNRQLNQAREEICDNYVLTDRDPVSYSETLLRIAEIVCISRPVVGAVGILFGQGRLEQRIAGLIDERRSTMTHFHRLLAQLTFGCCLIASIFVCGVTIVAARPQTATDANSRKVAQESKDSIPPAINPAVLRSTHISPDGRVQVILKEHGKFEILDTHRGGSVASGEVLHEYVDSNGENKVWRHVSRLAFAQAGRRVALLNPGGTIEIRDWRTAETLDTVRLNDTIIELLRLGESIVLSADGKSIVLYNPGLGLPPRDGDKTMGFGVLIDVRSGKQLREFRGLVSAAALGDGTLLGAIQNDSKKTLQVFDLRAGKLRQNLEGPHKEIQQGRFATDGSYLAGAAPGRLTVWNAKSGKRLFQWTGPKFETFEHGGLAFARVGKEQVLLATSYEHSKRIGFVGRLRALRLPDGAKLWEQEIANDFPSAPTILPDGKRFAFRLLRKKLVEVRSIATGEKSSP